MGAVRWRTATSVVAALALSLSLIGTVPVAADETQEATVVVLPVPAMATECEPREYEGDGPGDSACYELDSEVEVYLLEFDTGVGQEPRESVANALGVAPDAILQGDDSNEMLIPESVVLDVDGRIGETLAAIASSSCRFAGGHHYRYSYNGVNTFERIEVYGNTTCSSSTVERTCAAGSIRHQGYGLFANNESTADKDCGRASAVMVDFQDVSVIDGSGLNTSYFGFGTRIDWSATVLFHGTSGQIRQYCHSAHANVGFSIQSGNWHRC